MDEIHVHKTKKSICAHFAESPCNKLKLYFKMLVYKLFSNFIKNYEKIKSRDNINS